MIRDIYAEKDETEDDADDWCGLPAASLAGAVSLKQSDDAAAQLVASCTDFQAVTIGSWERWNRHGIALGCFLLFSAVVQTCPDGFAGVSRRGFDYHHLHHSLERWG